MSQLPIIHKERFEAWLMSQPDERTFNYLALTDCLVCKFIRENTNCQNVSAGGTYYLVNDSYEKNPIPGFIYAVLAAENNPVNGTFGGIKRAYRTLYPESTETLSAACAAKTDTETVSPQGDVGAPKTHLQNIKQ